MLTIVAFPATSIKKAICTASDFSMCPGVSWELIRFVEIRRERMENTHLLNNEFAD